MRIAARWREIRRLPDAESTIYGRRRGVRAQFIAGGVAFAYRDEFPAVIAELEAGRIDQERLISHAFRLDDIQAAFEMQADANHSVKVTVDPRG